MDVDEGDSDLDIIAVVSKDLNVADTDEYINGLLSFPLSSLLLIIDRCRH